MKIGMLSQWFDPEPGPAAIPGVIAREFVRSGHEVTVLTGFPNYPEGKIYPGFDNRRVSVSSSTGFPVTRVPLHPSHDRSALGRLANYSSFAISASIFGRDALKSADAIWVYNSPATVSLPLFVHSKWGRKPIFLQVQDLWPDSLIDSGMFPGGTVGKLAASVISSIVKFTENHSAVIGVSSEGARAVLLDRNPRLDPSVIISSPNPTDESLFRPVEELPREAVPEVPWQSSFTVMYVGAVGEVQGLDSLIEAARILRGDDRIKFVIVGDGIAHARLTALAAEYKLHNLTFTGRVDKSLVPGYLATASVQLVSLAERSFLEYTTPSKIASLLASGVPIIGQLSGDGARLIQDAGAGLLAVPENGESLATVVLEMVAKSSSQLAEYGRRGRSYYESNLSAQVVASNVVRSLRALG
jgi:colanic acid biosynthesis glycosyl transferase WcaI